MVVNGPISTDYPPPPPPPPPQWKKTFPTQTVNRSKVMHCGIWNCCIVRFVQTVYFYNIPQIMHTVCFVVVEYGLLFLITSRVRSSAVGHPYVYLSVQSSEAVLCLDSLKRRRLMGTRIPIICLRRSDEHPRFVMDISIQIKLFRLSE